jgi:hypothetical protein
MNNIMVLSQTKLFGFYRRTLWTFSGLSTTSIFNFNKEMHSSLPTNMQSELPWKIFSFEKRWHQAGNISLFPHLSKILAGRKGLYQHYQYQKNKIVFHLDFFSEELMHCFPDATLDNPVWKFVRNSFDIYVVDSLPDPFLRTHHRTEVWFKNVG